MKKIISNLLNTGSTKSKKPIEEFVDFLFILKYILRVNDLGYVTCNDNAFWKAENEKNRKDLVIDVLCIRRKKDMKDMGYFHIINRFANGDKYGIDDSEEISKGDTNMTVKEFLTLQECSYDIYDTEIDAVVTCEYIDEINDNYDKFCDLIQSKVKIVKGGDCPIANWSELITKNFEKFKAFAKEHWRYSYDDDELIYQWIKEFHAYLAGMVSENFYEILVKFFEEIEPVTE